MKEAVIIDVEGFYKGVVLVEDTLTGVLPIYEYIEDKLSPNEFTQALIGYQVAIKVQEGLHLPKLDLVNEIWVEGKLFDLEAYKGAKVEGLNLICNQKVLEGYYSSALGEPHFYSFDYEAQINLAGVKEMFNFNPNFTEITWATSDGDFIHTKDQFTQLWLDGFIHKNTIVGTYKAYKSAIHHESITTKEQVDGFVWD